jgi:hypothetical protein
MSVFGGGRPENYEAPTLRSLLHLLCHVKLAGKSIIEIRLVLDSLIWPILILIMLSLGLYTSSYI